MRSSITLVPQRLLSSAHPVQTQTDKMGPPGGQNMTLRCCSASRAQPQSSTHQHPPSPWWSGAASSPPQLSAHLGDVLLSGLALRLPKINQLWETRSTEGCEQVLGPVGLSKRAPDPAHHSQPKASPAAQTGSEYGIFLPCSCHPQPPHHAAFLHPRKVLPAPKLSGSQNKGVPYHHGCHRECPGAALLQPSPTQRPKDTASEE